MDNVITPEMKIPVINPTTEYPKLLYKGEHYTDWQKFCIDLENKVIKSTVVTSEAQEKLKRSEGFTDAGTLMQPIQDVEIKVEKKRGMPKGGWPKKCPQPTT